MPVPRPVPAARRASERVAAMLPMLAPAVVRPPIALGVDALDALLGGGLARAALHEIYAQSEADAAAATGFAAGIAHRAAGGRSMLWVRHNPLDALGGRLHAPGLASIGIDPARILLVRAPDIAAMLRAGAEGARCAALGAVLIEPWGESRLIDLTASRRLQLAARASGVPVLMLRSAAEPAPSAATTRWRIAAAPSRAQPGNAPGLPAFAATLLRQRGGGGTSDWILEWNHDRSRFEHIPAPLSGGVVPVPAVRTHTAQRRAA